MFINACAIEAATSLCLKLNYAKFLPCRISNSETPTVTHIDRFLSSSVIANSLIISFKIDKRIQSACTNSQLINQQTVLDHNQAIFFFKKMNFVFCSNSTRRARTKDKNSFFFQKKRLYIYFLQDIPQCDVYHISVSFHMMNQFFSVAWFSYLYFHMTKLSGCCLI